MNSEKLPSSIIVDVLSVAECERNPDIIYVFGDNLLKKGKAGQAVIRDCPNAFGIPTKRLPSMKDDAFFSDRCDEKTHLAETLDMLYLLSKSHVIAWPKAGIGTGLARLEEKSPMLNEILQDAIAIFLVILMKEEWRSNET